MNEVDATRATAEGGPEQGAGLSALGDACTCDDEVAEKRADEAYKSFGEALKRCLELDPEAVLTAAVTWLETGSADEQVGAAWLIGRLGEADLGATAERCSALLFERLLAEADPCIRDALAAGLGLIWRTRHDYDAVLLPLAAHPNANVRFAAAESLAFTTTDRADDEGARAVLETLARDLDEAIRDWARFGLERPSRRLVV